MDEITPVQIQWLRGALGLSRAQLGRVLGVTGKSIHFWETGRGRPGGTSREALRACLTLARKKTGAQLQDVALGLSEWLAAGITVGGLYVLFRLLFGRK